MRKAKVMRSGIMKQRKVFIQLEEDIDHVMIINKWKAINKAPPEQEGFTCP